MSFPYSAVQAGALMVKGGDGKLDSSGISRVVVQEARNVHHQLTRGEYVLRKPNAGDGQPW
ncbi:MAG: hypothetical protein EBW73_11850 [Betaproteobacteria bacterium]|nr:hypothetical protein [Betaproteobacteria bacterium]NCX13485.1 hypothetical protein [Betaproteobacteria bacterium]